MSRAPSKHAAALANYLALHVEDLRGAEVVAEVGHVLECPYHLLIVGNFVSPYTTAALKHPFEPSDNIVEHRKIIFFAPLSIWMYDTRTGKILSKTWRTRKLM